MEYNVVIIGAGGTGSIFIERFAQFVSSKPDMRFNVAVVDGDMYEEKNMGRQLCGRADLLQNKAMVMCQKVKESFNLDWVAFCKYIDTPDDIIATFRSIKRTNMSVDVLFGFCDNHRCRQCMEKYFNASPNLIYIDSANEYSVGEVVVGIKSGEKIIAPSRAHYFPEVMRARGKRASELSCGAVNKSAPQHFATNNEAAGICFTLAAALIGEGRLFGGIVFFDTFTFSKVFREYKAEEVACDDTINTSAV